MAMYCWHGKMRTSGLWKTVFKNGIRLCDRGLLHGALEESARQWVSVQIANERGNVGL